MIDFSVLNLLRIWDVQFWLFPKDINFEENTCRVREIDDLCSTPFAISNFFFFLAVQYVLSTFCNDQTT